MPPVDGSFENFSVAELGFISHLWSSRRALSIPVTALHFQLVTVCHQFTAFFFRTLFRLVPVFSPGIVVGAVSQNADHIHNGEVPFLPLCIPRHADLLIPEKLDCVVLRFFHLIPFIPNKPYFLRRVTTRSEFCAYFIE